MKNLSLALFIIFIFQFDLISGESVKKDESILFFPTYAFQSGKNTVSAEIHGWVYEPEDDSHIRKIIIKALRSQMDLKKVEEEYRVFKNRIKAFLFDNERGKVVLIELNGRRIAMNKSKSNGHFTSTIEQARSGIQGLLKTDKILNYKALLPDDDSRVFKGRVQLISASGISVISDIDDTIKISAVLNKKELIRNTFAREFIPVKGMSSLYGKWKKRGAVFHYVSGSPWQLYLPISQFMEKFKFPKGSAHLRSFRIKDLSAIKFIKADQLAYKTDVISKIIKRFPKRKFILVGDSGEKDPEVYANIAKRFKKQVIAIYIRDVGNSGKGDSRYRDLFGNLTDARCKVFTNSDELADLSIDN